MSADAAIDSERIQLLSGRFGPAKTSSFPQDYHDLANAPSHNVATETGARVGDVIAIYNSGTTGIVGWSEFVYLKFEGTGAPTCAAKQVCVQDAAGAPYTYTNDPDSALYKTGDPRAVVAISAMTDAYYGWFWSGGVCPEWLVSGLGGTYVTNGDVIAGPIIAADPTTADQIGFGPVAGDTQAFIGFAEATDA